MAVLWSDSHLFPLHLSLCLAAVAQPQAPRRPRGDDRPADPGHASCRSVLADRAQLLSRRSHQRSEMVGDRHVLCEHHCHGRTLAGFFLLATGAASPDAGQRSPLCGDAGSKTWITCDLNTAFRPCLKGMMTAT